MNKVKSLADFHLPRWQQLPSMPLYLEQVLALLEEWLGPYLGKEDGTILTKTMINNYVKLHFVQPPIRRKYDRLTVASLFVIAVLKPVYTIEEIGYLIRLSLGHSDPTAAYDDFCDCAEAAVSCPPAIPVAVCGERITPEAAQLMEELGIGSVSVVQGLE